MAKIPITLEAGTADGRLANASEIYNESSRKFVDEELSSLTENLNKYSEVTAASSMSVDAATFTGNSIVKVSSACDITSIAALNYEVIFVVEANVAFSLPAGVNIIGEADNTLLREFSILDGNVVAGNFEQTT